MIYVHQSEQEYIDDYNYVEAVFEVPNDFNPDKDRKETIKKIMEGLPKRKRGGLFQRDAKRLSNMYLANLRARFKEVPYVSNI